VTLLPIWLLWPMVACEEMMAFGWIAGSIVEPVDWYLNKRLRSIDSKTTENCYLPWLHFDDCHESARTIRHLTHHYYKPGHVPDKIVLYSGNIRQLYVNGLFQD